MLAGAPVELRERALIYVLAWRIEGDLSASQAHDPLAVPERQVDLVQRGQQGQLCLFGQANQQLQNLV
jgi:hypothetical protein